MPYLVRIINSYYDESPNSEIIERKYYLQCILFPYDEKGQEYFNFALEIMLADKELKIVNVSEDRFGSFITMLSQLITKEWIPTPIELAEGFLPYHLHREVSVTPEHEAGADIRLYPNLLQASLFDQLKQGSRATTALFQEHGVVEPSRELSIESRSFTLEAIELVVRQQSRFLVGVAGVLFPSSITDRYYQHLYSGGYVEFFEGCFTPADLGDAFKEASEAVIERQLGELKRARRCQVEKALAAQICEPAVYVKILMLYQKYLDQGQKAESAAGEADVRSEPATPPRRLGGHV